MGKIMLSICNRDCDAEILENNKDTMKIVIRCPYCGQRTTVGQTYMISGFVGCPNCYWSPGGLREVVEDLRKNNYEAYVKGDFYRKGYLNGKTD